jgi:aspartyl-tRNA(Asn)/glutamyl-tRNA(Gln) amidotransferase subunit A
LPGLKASYGRIPGTGLTTLSQNAVVGALATTITDTARLLDVMAGPDRRDRTCLPASGVRFEDVIETLDVEGLRVAFSADLGFAIVDDEVAALSEAAARELTAAAGARPVAVAVTFDDYLGVYSRIERADMWIDIPEGRYPERADELDPLVRPGWDAAARSDLIRFAGVYRARREIEHRCAAYFDEFDVLITPATSIPAFAAEGPMPTTVAGRRTHTGMSVPFAMLANLCNLPSISLPAGRTSDGLPVGILVTADRHREDICLRLGRILEQHAPWPRHASSKI